MLGEGEIPGTRIEGNWRIRRSKLEEWLDESVSKKELLNLSKKLDKVNQEEVKEFMDQLEED